MWWSPAGQSGVVVQSILDAAGYFLWDNRRNIFKQFREKFRKDFLGDSWSNFFCKGSEFMSRASEIWSIEFHCGLGWKIRMFARIVTRNLQAFPWTLHWRAPCGPSRLHHVVVEDPFLPPLGHSSVHVVVNHQQDQHQHVGDHGMSIRWEEVLKSSSLNCLAFLVLASNIQVW